MKLSEPITDFEHSDEIMDIMELTHPELCIAIASMDKDISLYSLKKKQNIRKLNSHHQMAVKSLLFYPKYGNLLLSQGNEAVIYVWSMENLISDPLFGKIRGNKMPISSMVRGPDQPFVYTIDVGGIIKMFDIRTLACLQTIVPNPRIQTNEVHTGLAILSRSYFLSFG
jgi:WD40 repeat protein